MGQQLGSIGDSYVVAPACALYAQIFGVGASVATPLVPQADPPRNLDNLGLPRFPEFIRHLPKPIFTRCSDWIWKSHTYKERRVPRTRIWRNLVVDTVYPKPPPDRVRRLIARHEPYPEWLQKQFDETQIFVTINGQSTKKRRAEDTEVDLVATLRRRKYTKPPYTRPLEIFKPASFVTISRPGTSADTELDATFIHQEATPTESVTNMASSILSGVTGLGGKMWRLLFNQTYSVSESRYLVNVQNPMTKTCSVHVANKRVKLRRDDFEPQWLNHRELAKLISEFQHFRKVLDFVCKSTEQCRSRSNQLLGPLLPVLVDNSFDMQMLDSGRPEHDLSSLFNLMCSDMCLTLEKMYNVGTFFKTKAAFDDNHAPIQGCYQMASKDILATTRIKNFMSAPSLFTVLRRILDMGGLYASCPLPVSFFDRIVLDMNAISNNIMVPSYITSDVFHQRVRILFPPPQRTDVTLQGCLPGAYPGPDISQPPLLHVHYPTEKTESALNEEPVYVASGKVAARYRMRHPVKKEQRRTREEFDRKYYQKGGIREAIKRSYVKEFVAKEPPKQTGITSLTSILTNRKTHPSKCSPKRLAIRRPPKTVRFTEDTLSPRPRSHVGCEIPRIKDGDNSTEQWPLAGVSETRSEFCFKSSASRLSAEQPQSRQADASAAIEQILSLPSIEGLRISDDTRAGIALKKEEAAQKAAEEARKLADERAQQEREERLVRTGGLRVPEQPIASPVSVEWRARAEATLRANNSTTLATTAEGIDLRRHDFSKVVPETEWLNDEIVNGSLNWLDHSINSAAGIKDVKRHTRKCLSMSSFFFKRLQEQGVSRTQRTLRRYGVEKRNMLDIDTVLLPICEHSHWTIIAIRPGKRTIAHIDSLNPRGSQRYLELCLTWLKDVLEEEFVEAEWKFVQHEAPRQVNGYDCGVHTITNGICVALGLNPIDSYTSNDMPGQRVRIACMLLNGGFKGDFALEGY